MQTDKDFYKTLKVERKASEDDIRNSYRALVQEYHPDNSNDPGRYLERSKKLMKF